MRTLHIFRRDLRLHDNTSLLAAARKGEVLACFILDPRQIDDNAYRSDHAMRFMTESLIDLNEQLGGRLLVREGIAEDVIDELIDTYAIDTVHINRDYTPFSRKRDASIATACKRKGVEFESFPDALLNEPDAIEKNDGGPYTVFTPFFNKAVTIEVAGPKEIAEISLIDSGDDAARIDPAERLPDSLTAVPGGRSAGLAALGDIYKQEQYDMQRDIPALDATTHLSAHLKFGTLSVREVYHAIVDELGPYHELLRQLYWRDFFTHIAFHFPHVFGHSFYERYDKISWEDDEHKFKRWCEGKTGFPIVDAGMRELKQTGYMHNRTRMITASFLVKDLHIDWRKGENHFARHLVDYDPAVNNGNWQWAASTGCDAAPYFRIFNPWMQQKKYDPQAKYIKQWVPELRELDADAIHKLENSRPDDIDYPEPIVDHKVESKAAKDIYKDVV